MIIVQIGYFLISMQFVSIHHIHDSMLRKDLEELGNIEMVILVTCIYGKSLKLFFLKVNNEVEAKEMLFLALFSKFYGYYTNLVHIHSTRKPTIAFVKNSGNIFHKK